MTQLQISSKEHCHFEPRIHNKDSHRICKHSMSPNIRFILYLSIVSQGFILFFGGLNKGRTRKLAFFSIPNLMNDGLCGGLRIAPRGCLGGGGPRELGHGGAREEQDRN